MTPADSPFPSRWWGIGLDKAGLPDVRPRLGTYGAYDFALLPPAPAGLCGDFAWLASAPHQDPNIAAEQAAENAAACPRLHAAAARAGLALPPAFRAFLDAPPLARRIRSCTDCLLSLGPEPVASPLGGGHLVRFLSDSQGCLHWYLYLVRGGADHAVVSAPDLYGEPDSGDDERVANPAEIAFAAASFEEFLWRFWVENELWFAAWKQTRVPEAGRAYVEEYRRRAAARPGA